MENMEKVSIDKEEEEKKLRFKVKYVKRKNMDFRGF